MRMYEILEKKRNGGVLSEEEIRFFVEGYTADRLPDYQAAALLMAICLNGMTDEETVCLTRCMAQSGEQLDLSALGDSTVDKHSTGGVGDKTTLIVAPLVAALGGRVAKLSGRGLGHTGGTIDKLESLPGFQTALPPDRFVRQVLAVGAAVAGQTGNLAPADKKLYALRDVTATVESIPLIASSVMSKKLAAGARSIVLDVKVGSGAFLKTRTQAEILARLMVMIGRKNGRRVRAVLSNMDVPLGYAIGNALEVQEAVSVLRGEGCEDLTELCVVLASHMLSLCLEQPLRECEKRVRGALKDGAGLRKLREIVAAQGGDPTYIDHPEKFPLPAACETVLAPRDGYVTRLDARQLGGCAMLLGAGRETKDDPIDSAAGIRLKRKTGERVRAGEPLAVLCSSDASRLLKAREALASAVEIGDKKPAAAPLVWEVVE